MALRLIQTAGLQQETRISRKKEMQHMEQQLPVELREVRHRKNRRKKVLQLRERMG